MIPFLDHVGANRAVEEARARARALKGAALGLAFGGQGAAFLLPGGALYLMAETVARVKVACPHCGRDVSAWADERQSRDGVRLPPMETWMACPVCGFTSETGRELLAPILPPPRQDGAEGDAGRTDEPLTAPLLPARAPEMKLTPGPLPWTPGLPAEPPPAQWPSGYWWHGRVLPADGEELRRLCDGAPPLAVWTSETGGWARPEAIPSLFETIREGYARRAARGVGGPLGFAAGAAVAVVAAAVLGQRAFSLASFGVFLAMAGLVYAAISWREGREARKITPEGYRGTVFAALHDGWIRGRPATLTRFLSVCLIGVGVLQLVARERSLEVAALWEPALAAGEWWRVATAGLVHAGELHFLVNFLALQQLGRLTEVHAHRTLLPLVFLASVLTGSAAQALLTDSPAVGASGGLLGVIGFLGVCSLRRAAVLPHGFRKTIVTDLAAIAAVGLVGVAVVANAGHFGGLVGGAALGLLLVPSAETRPGIGWTPAMPVQVAGWVAAAGVALTAVWTALLILGRV